MKAGEQKAETRSGRGGEIYVSLANEFPTTPRATAALTNAATLYVKAGKPEEAVKLDAVLVDKYPQASETPAGGVVGGQALRAGGAVGSGGALLSDAGRSLSEGSARGRRAVQRRPVARAPRRTQARDHRVHAVRAALQDARRREAGGVPRRRGLRRGRAARGGGEAFADYALKYPGTRRPSRRSRVRAPS